MKVLTKKIRHDKSVLAEYLYDTSSVALDKAIDVDELPAPYNSADFRAGPETRGHFLDYLHRVHDDRKNYVYVKTVRIVWKDLNDLVRDVNISKNVLSSISIADGHLSPDKYDIDGYTITPALQAYSAYIYIQFWDRHKDGTESAEVSWYVDFWHDKSIINNILTLDEPIVTSVLWEGFV